MKFQRIRAAALAIIAAVALTASSAQASTIAATFDNTSGSTLGNPPFTLGWSFTANSDITVTDLGLFDSEQDGLVDRYEIGLWDSGGNLLVSTILPSGTSAPLDGVFRFNGVTGTNLAAGQTYFIGALFVDSNDPLIFPGVAVNFATAPEVSFLANQFAGGGALTFPGLSTGSDPAYFAANFRFTAVPEPATMTLLGLGAASFLVRRRRAAK